MKKKHYYTSNIKWTGNKGKGTEAYNSYERSYNIDLIGKTTIKGSSDPAFLGDKTKHNPEDLLLASISSCHMLWYLHLCATEKICVIAYTDKATAIMEEFENGSGKFIEVILNPVVTIAEPKQKQLAILLHKKANEMCFIANSLNFKVNHYVKVIVKS